MLNLIMIVTCFSCNWQNKK